MSRRKKASRGNPASLVTLYHYTHKRHLASIRASGVLRTTESNVSLRREHAGPDVLWLTSNPGALGSVENGLRMANGASKAQVRFTIRVPRSEVHAWTSWAARQGSDARAQAALARAGGSREWMVIERPVPEREWVAVDEVT